MSRRGANLRAVEKYVVHVRAARYPGTAGSVVETLTFTGKPESSAPHTPAGERHMDHGDNSETRRLLEPVIEEWLRGRYSDSWMLIEAAPTEITAWRSGGSTEARETAWKFDRAVAEVERELERRNPGVRLSVVVNPYHEPIQKEGAPHHRERRLGVEDSYRRRYERLRAIESAGDITRTAAVDMLAQEAGVGVATIWRCVAFARGWTP